MSPLILKRAPIGDNQDDYDVLENGVIVGRIFTVPTAPQGRPWMWASGHAAGHGRTRTTRLRADPQGCDGGVREELAQWLGRVALINRPAMSAFGQTGHWSRHGFRTAFDVVDGARSQRRGAIG
jgi:hypothetical protein